VVAARPGSGSGAGPTPETEQTSVDIAVAVVVPEHGVAIQEIACASVMGGAGKQGGGFHVADAI